jgi:hypothetical protein
VYPTPDQELVVEFPATLHFDSLDDVDEVPPCPYGHDETLKAACKAVVEQEENEVPGPATEYYLTRCIPNSHAVDARSAPRRLGYNGDPSHGGMYKNPGRYFRDHLSQRPNVTFNP